MKDKAEDILCEQIKIGGSNLFLVCDDLKKLIEQGLLIEIPISSTLDDILSLDKIKSEQEYYSNKLTKPLAKGLGLETQFKTIPGGAIYELKFWDSEKSGYYGYFKKK